MTILTLLERLRELDVRVRLDGERLRVSAPPGVLTPELQRELAASKRDLIALLKAGQTDEADAPIAHIDASGPQPLSFTQERMWLLHELEPESTAYHLVQIERFRGDLDVDALARAWHGLAARHDVLRSRVRSANGVPFALVDDDLQPAAYRFEDFRGEPEDVVAERARAIVLDESERPFDLATGPLAAMVVIRVAEADHLVVLRLHHIVTDYWSQGLIRQELSALYQSALSGTPSGLPDLPVRYADFAAWHRARLEGPEGERLLGYWRHRLHGLEPLDVSGGLPQADDAVGGGEFRVELPDGLLDRLNALATRSGATLFMTTLAAFAILLFRYSGRTDFSIGTPVAGRTRREIEPLVGAFINTLVLRLRLRPQTSVREVIDLVRSVALDAFAHGDAPFERLVAALVPAREASATPLVQVLFNLLGDQPRTPVFPGLTIEPIGVGRRHAVMELALVVNAADGSVALETRRDLVFGVRPEAVLAHYVGLLEQVATDPDACIATLSLLTPAERAVLADLNRTTQPFDPDVGVEALVARQALERPEAVAVRAGDRILTYGDLEDRVCALADRLRTYGVGPGALVGVSLQRTELAPIAFLAVMRAGGAYLPLDPEFPADRLHWMIEDSQVRLVLADQASAAVLPAAPGVRVLDLGTDDDLVIAPAEHADARAACGDDLAYVLYTSGSTGRPKGVQLPRRALVNLVRATAQRPGMGPGDVLVAVTTFSFDIAVLELFLPLAVGGTVVMAARHEVVDGAALRTLIAACDATIMQATPATWRLLIAAGWQGSAAFRVFCGGEPLPPDLASQLVVRAGAVWNLYGPTETTVWSTVARVEAGGHVGIGTPLANTDVYVVDASRQVVPPGVPGELYLGGAGLARGYVNRPDLTARVFVPDAFSGRPGARLYRTGDRVRVTEAGDLEFLGRVDAQIKLRGFRIEPAEIEAVLGEHPAIAVAAVVIRERAGEPLLVAYLLTHGSDVPTDEDLRTHLLRRLPAYMVPALFRVLETFPLTPNGKIDRRALPAIPSIDGAQVPAASADDIDAIIQQILTELLGRPVSADDDFFAVGGHSLLAARVAARIEDALGVHVPLSHFFDAPTHRQLAAYVRARRQPASPATVAAPATATPFRSLVSVRTNGRGIAVFGVHAGAGQVLFYRHFARLIGEDHPFYGLQAPEGLDGLGDPYGPHRSVNSLAEQYIDEMRQVQPHGPYAIVGPCMGGNVALEMARMLREAGEVVDPLIIVDSWLWNTSDPVAVRAETHRQALSRLSWVDRVRYLAAKTRTTIAFHYRTTCDRLRAYPAYRRRAREVARAKRRGIPASPHTRDWNFLRTSIALANQHQPRPYDGRIVLIRSATYATSPWISSEQAEYMGWRGIAVGDLEILDLPGTHLEMFEPPIVADLVKIVRERLSTTVPPPDAARRTSRAADVAAATPDWSDVTHGAFVLATLLMGA